ncbi:hypothetical protein BC830DRAFT_218102 [Chytriomyces sp. MP71]|nr:hypothetical protein BC830DRAFT_218102 [Chytriomyces sp. MP71]
MRFYTHVTIAINVSQFVRLSSSPLRHPARNHLETTLLESSTSTLLEDEITAGTSDLLFDWATRTPNDAMPHTAESVHSPADTDVDTPEFIASLFNRGAAFHHAGMRACYCVFPVLGYLWGWRILVLSTPMLLITLKAVDDVDSFFGFMRWVTGRRRVDRGSLSDCTIRLV